MDVPWKASFRKAHLQQVQSNVASIFNDGIHILNCHKKYVKTIFFSLNNMGC